jgi:hypothetical protein
MRFVSYFTDAPARGVRRDALVACVLVACAACLPAALPAPALGATGGAPVVRNATGAQDTPTPLTAPLVSATLEQCLTTGEQADRSATFDGEMETVPGTRRMAMQILVQELVPEEDAFRTITAPGLGVWQHSEVGVKIYKYVRQVTNLSVPGTFRAIVQYRWLNEKNHVIKRAVRHTQLCVQPELRVKVPVEEA